MLDQIKVRLMSRVRFCSIPKYEAYSKYSRTRTALSELHNLRVYYELT